MKTSHIVEGVAAGAGFGAAAAWFGWRKRKRVATHFQGLFRGEEAIVRVSGLLETFFNEAAVLWFVFQLLDAIYEAKKDQPIGVLNLVGIVVATWSVALAFFYFAAFFKKLEKDGEKRLALLKKGKDD